MFRTTAHPGKARAFNAQALPGDCSFRTGAYQALECVFDIFPEVPHARLGLAEVLLDIAFHFHLPVPDDLAGDFLDFALGFFNAAFDLLFVHCQSPMVRLAVATMAMT